LVIHYLSKYVLETAYTPGKAEKRLQVLRHRTSDISARVMDMERRKGA